MAGTGRALAKSLHLAHPTPCPSCCPAPQPQAEAQLEKSGPPPAHLPSVRRLIPHLHPRKVAGREKQEDHSLQARVPERSVPGGGAVLAT